MKCYGKYFGRLPECAGCRMGEYCRGAGDLSLLGDRMPSVADYKRMAAESLSGETDYEPDEREYGECYSRGDLLEVIGFMMSMDITTLDFLAAKLGDPEISFSKMARAKNISRQAVHKFILKRCRQIPELAAVLQNRGHRNYINSQKGFMEEVCKIRKKARVRRLNRSKPNLTCSRKLICWNRNFDLSKMSMLKGTAILRQD